MKIAVYGYGAMGKLVSEKLKEKEGVEFLGAVDESRADEKDIFKTLEHLPKPPQVIIDFSHYSKLEPLLEYCKKNSCGLFVATTGHTEEQKKDAENMSKYFPVIMATNTSLGVNLLNELMKIIVPVLEDWDIELIEKHHNKKLDSPSGTAKTFLEKINETLTKERGYIHGREGMKKREKNEIGVHSLRGGTIVGEHSVIFAGEDEVVEIKHEAHSKAIFANGAITGALWLCNKKPGFYTMKEVLFEN